MKKILIAVTALLLMLVGVPGAHATPPPFEGVEKYTPTYEATCEAATFSHPAIKTGLGVANVYGVRYGASQTEAQLKPFLPYTPGETVTYTFEQPYVDNTYYFEVKVGFDGVNLKQQIGQTRGTSTACIYVTPDPIPVPSALAPPTTPAAIETASADVSGWPNIWGVAIAGGIVIAAGFMIGILGSGRERRKE